MRFDFVISVAATLVLLAGTVAGLRRPLARDGRFWALIGASFAGTGAAAAASLAAERFGMTAALWLTAATVIAAFAVLAALHATSVRLSALLFPYLAILGVAALAFGNARGEAAETSAWGLAHAAIALFANALVTVAAVAALAVVIQERALKARRRSALAGILPGAAESEGIQGVLLGLAAAALALGVATGTALQLEETGRILVFNHKTVLTLAALILIAVLAVVDFRSGLSGRKLARGILVSWLILTLGFLGVIFVKQIIL